MSEYHTRTWQECWDSSKERTAKYHYPERLLARAGHTLLMRIESANPQGYSASVGHSQGRILVQPSFVTGSYNNIATEVSVDPTSTYSADPHEYSEELSTQPTDIDTAKPE